MEELAARAPRRRHAILLGPAFVAAVAYVDPGNVAANLTAGAQYRYALVWVLVASSLVAVLVQYLSAKLGIVTGRTLSELVAEHLEALPGGHRWRIAYGVQALLVSIATDVAEVVGGALGLHLLVGTPMWLGALLVGIASLVLLRALRMRGEGAFEAGVTGVLGLVALGFLGSLAWARPDWRAAASGLSPRLPDHGALLLAGAMLGATVMPHAIYLHSNLARDRHRPDGVPSRPIGVLLRIQRVDVLLSLLLAGSVNVAMLLVGAAALPAGGGDSVVSAHSIIDERLGSVAGVVLALGLLASGVGSAVVGTHAGAGVWRDLIPWTISRSVRRAIILLPAVVVTALGIDPTRALVDSQLVLGFGIAFAMVPLVWFTSRREVMGEHVNPWPVRVLAWCAVALVVGLNAWLVLA